MKGLTAVGATVEIIFSTAAFARNADQGGPTETTKVKIKKNER